MQLLGYWEAQELRLLLLVLLSKTLGENLLAGIMLAFNRPFNIGNVVEIDGFVGTVKAL
jgi:small conductance mechanosensitive channel